MDGIVSVAGVGAVASNTQIKAAQQAQAVAIANDVAEDLGSSALKLIQASVVPVPTSTGSDLDVRV